MAPKPDSAVAKDLAGIIARGRKAPQNFAMLLSKDGVVLEADMRKSVDAMRKAAKSAGGTARGAWGRLSVNGKTIVLDCEAEPPGQFQKLARKHFADHGQKLQVEIRLDGGDEPAAAAPNGADTSEVLVGSGGDDGGDLDQDYPPDPDDPDSEDDLAAQSGEIAALIAAARKKTYNFAWLLGKDGLILKAHRRKPFEVLVKLAKSEGGGPRGAWGTLQVEGKWLVLTCPDDPPGDFSKRGKRYLRDHGLKQGVILRAPAGEVSEAPDEDDAAVGTGEMQQILAAEFALIEGPLDAVIAEADKGLAKKLGHFRTLFRDAMEAGDVIKAQKTLTMIKTLAGLKDVIKAPAYDPDAPDPDSDDGVPAPDDPIAELAETLRVRVNAIPEPSDPEAAKAFGAERAAILARLDSVTDSDALSVLSDDISDLEMFDHSSAGGPGGQPAQQSLHEALGLSAEEAAALDTWIDGNAMAREGMIFKDDVGGERLAAALRGDSDLGALGEMQQAYLTVKTARAWVAAPADPDVTLLTVENRVGENLDELTAAVKDDPALSAVVARSLLFANTSQQSFHGDYSVIEPARDISHELMLRALDLEPEDTVARLNNIYGPKSVAQLATGNAKKQILTELDLQNPDLHNPTFDELSEERRNAILNVASSGALHPADANVITSYMFDAADDDDVDTPEAQIAMGRALARSVTEARGLRGREAVKTRNRLIDVAASDGGQELLFNRKLNPVLRNWAVNQFAPDPGDPSATPLGVTDVKDGWESDAVAKAYAGKVLENAPAPYPESMGLDPNDPNKVPNLIGGIMGFPPDKMPPENETPEERAARLESGLDHGYHDTSKPPMSKIIKHLGEANSCPALVTPIPVSVTSNDFGAAVFKVLRVEAELGPIFIDNFGNRFPSFDDWHADNKLPDGIMAYPAGLVPGAQLVSEGTPNSRLGAKALDVADKAALAAGIVAGAVLIVGSGGTATPVVMAAAAAVSASTAAYSGGRAVSELAEKDKLGHDVSDLSDAEVRGLWLEVGSSALSVGGIGGAMRASNLASKGVKMGRAGANVVAGMQVAGNVVDAIALGDTITMLSVNWDKMDEAAKSKALLSLSMQAGMGAAGRAKGGGRLADDFSFTRTRNQLEHGSPFDLVKSDDVPEGRVAVIWDKSDPDNPRDFKIAYNSDSVPSREMIELHGRAASSMEASVSLRARVMAVLKGTTDPPRGSAAWEAVHELNKFRDESEGILKRLGDPALSPEERVSLEARIDEINSALLAERARLDRFEEPGNGYVAATETGADQARRMKLPDPPAPGGTGTADYIWVAGNPEPHLRPLHDDVPPCRWDAKTKTFVYQINRGWASETETDFNWYANNPQPNARYEYENGATYLTDDEGRTRTVTATLEDDPWDRDATTQRAVGHVGRAGNPSESYDGGHLIPRELGGAPGELNVVPMQSYLNQHGEWRKMERGWRDAVQAGQKVDIKIEVEYYASGNAARQRTPRRFVVVTTIDGKAQPPKIIKNLSSG